MTTETNRPTHYVYAVRKGTGPKAFWTRIGAAWANKDGEGFNLKLDLLPLNGAEIVIRTPREEREEAQDEALNEAPHSSAIRAAVRKRAPSGAR